MINAKEFNNQEKLAGLIRQIGFYPESAQKWRDFKDLPGCLLDPKQHGFDAAVIVSVLQEAFRIYFYNEIHFFWDNWIVLKGDITKADLREKILEAGSELSHQRVIKDEHEIWEWRKERKMRNLKKR